MAKPSTVRLQIQVEHVRIEVAKPFEAVKSALEVLVPLLDPAIPEALRQGDIVQFHAANFYHLRSEEQMLLTYSLRSGAVWLNPAAQVKD